MRKLTVLILALFLILTVSCASGNGSVEVFDEDFSSNETRFDLGGFCFEIRFYDDYTPEDGSVFGYKNGSEFNDIKRLEDSAKESGLCYFLFIRLYTGIPFVFTCIFPPGTRSPVK